MFDGLPYRHFKTISADVPWEYRVRSKKGTGRSAENHYSTMTLERIARLNVEAYAAPDAHLFFWVTGPFLALGAHVPIMKSWGFEPVSVAFVWVKTLPSIHMRGSVSLVSLHDERIFKMGMGHTTRQNAEYVILGRRGQPKRLSRGVRQIIAEAPREHSRKPEKFFDKVEQYAEGPYLELFGRTQRPNWVVRGNESGKFPAVV